MWGKKDKMKQTFIEYRSPNSTISEKKLSNWIRHQMAGLYHKYRIEVLNDLANRFNELPNYDLMERMINQEINFWIRMN